MCGTNSLRGKKTFSTQIIRSQNHACNQDNWVGSLATIISWGLQDLGLTKYSLPELMDTSHFWGKTISASNKCGDDMKHSDTAVIIGVPRWCQNVTVASLIEATQPRRLSAYLHRRLWLAPSFVWTGWAFSHQGIIRYLMVMVWGPRAKSNFIDLRPVASEKGRS